MTDSHGEGRRFFGAIKLIAALTTLSRLLGLVRDMAIVALGANRLTDAFWTAFKVPNLFRRLFGEGALAAAFVPVFTEVAEKEGLDKARSVLANAAGLLAVILAALVVAIEIALLLWWVLAPGGWDRNLLLQLVMIVLPFMFTVCLLALGSAALNCRGHFGYPAFAPILLNVALIAGAAAVHRWFPGGDWPGLFLLAGAAVLAGVVQLGGVVWLLRSVDLAVMPCLRPILAPVRRIGKLMLPMMVPLGIVQFSALFDAIYAWWMTATPDHPALEVLGFTIGKPLQPGVVTCVYAADRLYQFPLGILAISLATAVFPLLSRYAARGDLAGLRTATNRALRGSIFLGLPAGVGLVLLAEPAITLIYRHGKFTPFDTSRAAFVLQMYSLGMWAYFARHILLRAFFAQKDTRSPLRVALVCAAANVVLVVGLIFTPLRAGAIGLATAVTAVANVLVLTWILRARWGRLGLREIGVSVFRTVAATAALAAAVLLVRTYAAPWSERLADQWRLPWLGSAVVVIAGIVLGGGVFLLTAAALRCRELRELHGGKEFRPEQQQVG